MKNIDLRQAIQTLFYRASQYFTAVLELVLPVGSEQEVYYHARAGAGGNQSHETEVGISFSLIMET